MKNISLILIISFLTTAFTVKNEALKSDDSIFQVMALSGLKMRSEPSLTAKKILTIPYNESVTVLETGFGKLSVQELENFHIKGEWVKVSYDGKEGYVFNGYLTQFPLPDKEYPHYYYERVLKLSKDKHNIKYYEGCEPRETDEEENRNCICSYQENYYSDKVTFVNTYCGEEVMLDITTFTGVTFVELYCIVRVLYSNSEEDFEFEYNTEDQTISAVAEGEEAGSYSIEIKKIGENVFQILEGSSC